MKKHGSVLLRTAFALLGVSFLTVTGAQAQSLTFENHREIKVPEYATLRIGPLYSMLTFSQSAGYRYVKTSGADIDFVYDNGMGEIQADGSDFPLISTINMRNYLLVTKTCDLDLSLNASYEYYPMGTQADAFTFDLSDEGIYGNLSSEFELTDFVKGRVVERAVYKTDYVDIRGLTDKYGGQQYKHFDNNFSLSLDWLMARNDNIAAQLSREDILSMEDGFEEQDRTSYMEDLGYEHRFSKDLVSGVKSAFTQDSYTSVTNRPDAKSAQLTGFSTWKATDVSVVSAEAGYFVGAATDANMAYGNEDISGTVGVLSVDTKLAKRLSHLISAGRSAEVGFTSSYDITEFAEYRLMYKDDYDSGSLFTRYQNVLPSISDLGTYIDWVTGADYRFPLSRIVMLSLLTEYTIRQNNDYTADVQGEAIPAQYSEDYDTWRTKIGTGFAFTKEIYFDTYYEHIERISTVDEMSYSRDILAATFTYRHEF